MPRITSYSDSPRSRVAFTLIEMLVVIAMVGILISISIPLLRQMGPLVTDTSGTNTISVAIASARAYATRGIPAADSILYPGASYSGTAALFTPAGEVRLVENSQIVQNESGNLLEPNWNGYIDIPDVDYLTMPRDVGVVGIARTGTGDPAFLPPPFAVRFNERGHLIASADLTLSPNDALVIYDANANSVFLTGSGTGSSRNSPYMGGAYNPDQWDPRSNLYVAEDAHATNPGFHPVAKRQKLPFEKIEAVSGILTYSIRDFRQTGLSWAPTDDSARNQWFQENGTPIMFNRYTGVILRERGRP